MAFHMQNMYIGEWIGVDIAVEDIAGGGNTEVDNTEADIEGFDLIFHFHQL
jgi:hypothetical protein